MSLNEAINQPSSDFLDEAYIQVHDGEDEGMDFEKDK